MSAMGAWTTLYNSKLKIALSVNYFRANLELKSHKKAIR